jgi:hypothetical protein
MRDNEIRCFEYFKIGLLMIIAGSVSVERNFLGAIVMYFGALFNFVIGLYYSYKKGGH